MKGRTHATQNPRELRSLSIERRWRQNLLVVIVQCVGVCAVPLELEGTVSPTPQNDALSDNDSRQTSAQSQTRTRRPANCLNYVGALERLAVAVGERVERSGGVANGHRPVLVRLFPQPDGRAAQSTTVDPVYHHIKRLWKF